MEKVIIAIVEDEASIAIKIKSSLQNLGYEVTSIVDTAEDVLKKAEEDKPDIILMDIQIRGRMNGMEAADIIRSRFDIPVVLLLSDLNEERIEQVKVSMPFSYVLKPVQDVDLKLTIEMALYVVKVDAQRKKAEKELSDSRDRVHRQGAAITSLAVNDTISLGDIPNAMRILMEAITEIVKADRAGVWLFSEDPEELRCTALFESKMKIFSAGAGLKITGCPQYFKAIHTKNQVCAHDAQSDPQTSEFTESYLKPLGIASLLDVGIHIKGKLMGIVRLEQIGENRFWHPEEETFAHAIAALITQTFDNAERKQAEEALRISEKNYRELANLLPQVVFETDDKGELTFVNHYAFELFKYTQADFDKGLNALHMVALEEQEKAMINISKVLDGEMVGGTEYIMQKKDGTKFPVVVHSTPRVNQGRTVGLRGIIIDITDRKKSEQKLQASEKRYRQIFENTLTPYFETSLDGTLLEISPSVERYTNYKKEELIGKPIFDLYARPDQRDSLIKTVVENGELYDEIIDLRDKDGTVKNALLCAEYMPNEQKIVGSLLDITERENVVEALRESQHRLATHIELTPMGVIEFDAEFNITSWNPGAQRIFGYTAEEAIGHNALDILVPENERRGLQKAHLWDNPEATENINENKTKDRRIITCQWFNTPIFDVQGNAIRMAAVCQDITEKLQTEKALKESEAQKQAILNGISAEVTLVNEKLEILWANKAAAKSADKTPAEMLGKKCHLFFRDSNKPCENCPAIRVVQTKKPEQATVSTPDGRIWDERGEPVFDADGVLIGVVKISLNITNHKLAEEALQESAERFRALSEASFEAIFLSEKGICLEQNQVADRKFGYTLSEAIGKPGTDWIVPEHRELVKKHMLSGYEEPYEVNALCKDGSSFPAEIQGKMIHFQGRDVRVTALRDITDRKLVEEDLKKSEEKYRELAQSSNSIILKFDKNFNFSFINLFAQDFFGFSEDEIIGRNIFGTIVPEIESTGRNLKKNIKEIFDKPEAFADNENENIRKNGDRVWVAWRNKGIYDSDGKLSGMLCTGYDITKRKETEKALKDSEEKYRNVVSNAIEAICVMQDGIFQYFNPAAVSLFGYSTEELQQLPPDKTIYPEDKELVFSSRLRREQGEHILAYSHRIITKDGQIRWVDIKAVTITWNNRPASLVFLTDITDRKRSEELMIQTEKMMSVGGLAAGMAHELNNPLGGILQGIQNIQRRLSPDLKSNLEAARELGIDLHNLQLYMERRGIPSFIKGTLESGKKASQIISNMLQFSRKSESTMAPVNLIELLENALELAGKDYDLKRKYDFRNIKVIKEFDFKRLLVPCTETEIEQVFLNVLNNAAWAMANDKSDNPPQIILRINAKEHIARIEIEDNGPGMDETVRKRIFEPFYTTKPVGQGTGLGLSVSYMIITNNHLGTMEVESELGKGTKFTIRLPLKRE